MNDQPDERLARNLRELVKAASHVRYAASTRISSKASSLGNMDRENHRRHRDSSPGGIAQSSIGDLTDDQRLRVEAYVKSTGHYSPEVEAEARTSLPRPIRPQSTVSSSTNAEMAPAGGVGVDVAGPSQMETIDEAEDEDNDEDDSEDEDCDDIDDREYFDGLRDLAKDCLIDSDFAKAAHFFTKALDREAVRTNANNVETHEIELQLAICYFFVKIKRENVLLSIKYPFFDRRKPRLYIHQYTYSRGLYIQWRLGKP